MLLRERSQRYGGLAYAPWLDLLCELESDPPAAWQKREAAGLATERLAKEMEREMDFVVEPLDRGDVEKMIARCDELIARTREVRAGGQVGFLQKLRADALQIREAGSRADNLEEAIEALNDALSYAPPGAPALETMLDLARVHTEREVGDRVDNLAISSNMIEAALGLVTEDDPLELRGLLKYEFAKSLMRREDGERRENLARGVPFAKGAIADLEEAEAVRLMRSLVGAAEEKFEYR